MAQLIRQCAVAGRFYSGDPQRLQADLKSYLSPLSKTPQPVLGCVVPHAGYVYSGAVAGAVFSRIEIPHRCLVLCPNHTGHGPSLSIMSSGRWQTPLGDVPVDAFLAEELKRTFPSLVEDCDAHRSEHAIEVELPFLQARQPELTLTPIVIGTGRFEILAGLGESIASVIAAQEENSILIVASSDMNHYEDDATTRKKDAMAIEQILAIDPRGLFDVVRREDISMCGYGPTVIMLTAAKRLGAAKAELVQYATSGDAFGDRERVVGYAGILVA